MKKLATPILLLIFVISCNTTKYSSPESCACKQVILSESGGFSGQSTQSIILENGQVFEKTLLPETVKELKQLSKKAAKEIFEKAENLKLGTTDFIHPGNMTYMVALRNGTDYHEVKWGDPAYQAPSNVREFYQFVRKQLSSN